MASKAQKLDTNNQAKRPTVVAESGPPPSAGASGFRSRLAAVSSALQQGRSRLDGYDAALEKVAAGAPTFTELGHRVEAFRASSRKRLERFRKDAKSWLDESPRTVVSAAIGAARNALRSLSSGLQALANGLDATVSRQQSGGAPPATN